MRAQVSEVEFAHCVSDGACRPLRRKGAGRPGMPATGVSWEDATSYARWLSAKTGEAWRLPTDEEWVFAAGSRATDDAIETDAAGFSGRWLAKYERESERDRTGDRAPRPIGSFGVNEHGLVDLEGTVWEWTDTCFVRQSLDDDNRPVGTATVNCGVRVVQGAHRTYASNFIRDARGGGCSVGAPPDNLGFRLVREEGSWLSRMVRRIPTPFGRAA
jgi:formylglycine-generating enzyme required for sulfatase activity